MNCCPIMSIQEVEIDIILGTLTVWTTFHVEQNLLNLLFFPTSTAFWNNLDKNLKSIDDRSSFKNSIVEKKPTKKKYYFLGPRTTNILMARLRMRCSELNDLYSLHVSSTNICSCSEVETTEHYFTFTHGG